MNSFIIISKNLEKRQEYIQEFAAKHSIQTFDQTYIETAGESVGIELVRNLQKTLFLKPYQSPEKLIAINNAHLLTPEAQNALLKVLEEPPANTYLFLLADTSTVFLPTILSRCNMVILNEKKRTFTEEEIYQYITTLVKLREGAIGEKLALAERLAGEKEKLSLWFEGIILFLRDNMLTSPQESREVVRILQAFQEAYKVLQTTNVSPRILLEQMFLQLT